MEIKNILLSHFPEISLVGVLVHVLPVNIILFKNCIQGWSLGTVVKMPKCLGLSPGCTSDSSFLLMDTLETAGESSSPLGPAAHRGDQDGVTSWLCLGQPALADGAI